MITREAKFYLTDKWASSDGHQIEYRILLEDADGVDVKYLVTDYFNSDGTMHDTVIFNDNEDQNMVDSESYIGKKILTFMENGIWM